MALRVAGAERVQLNVEAGTALVRYAFCALLAWHFLRNALSVPAALEGIGLYDLRSLDLISSPANLWLGRGYQLGMLRLLFVCAAVACALATRLPGARFASLAVCWLSTSIYWALFPIADLDDLWANWLSLWLCLLPVVYTVRDGDRQVIKLFLASVFIAHLSVGYWKLLSKGWPPYPWIDGVFIASCGVLIAPWSFARRLAAIVLALLHCYLALRTRMVLIHGSLCVSLLLYFCVPRHDSHQSVNQFSARAAAGLCYIMLICLFAVSYVVGIERVEWACSRMLAIAGQVPLVGPKFAADIEGDLTVNQLGSRHSVPLFSGQGANDRTHSLVPYFVEAPSPGVWASLHASVRDYAARRACSRMGDNTQAVVSLNLTRHHHTIALARIECEGDTAYASWYDRDEEIPLRGAEGGGI